METSVSTKPDPISLYLERFPAQAGQGDPRFPFVSAHPMSQAAKYGYVLGWLPMLRLAAQEVLDSGMPITDWSVFETPSSKFHKRNVPVPEVRQEP